jgi:hypothetical protein
MIEPSRPPPNSSPVHGDTTTAIASGARSSARSGERDARDPIATEDASPEAPAGEVSAAAFDPLDDSVGLLGVEHAAATMKANIPPQRTAAVGERRVTRLGFAVLVRSIEDPVSGLPTPRRSIRRA